MSIENNDAKVLQEVAEVQEAEESKLEAENEETDESKKHLRALEEFHKLLQSDSSDEDDSIPIRHELRSNSDELKSDLVDSNDATSAVVGTSKNSSESIRNVKHLIKIFSPILSENGPEPKILNKKKSIVEFSQASLFGNETDQDQLSSMSTEEYELDNLNLAETLTIFEDEQDHENKTTKLKRAATTILLTQKWGHAYKTPRGKKRKQKAQVKYQPTYRMEPKINLNTIKYLIEKKVRTTFESLCEKHGKYDTEYTPRFLIIITEMLKNDVKSFKLDRYKIIVHVSILKKVFHQSIQFVSKELFNIDDDHKIALRADTKGFCAICLIFLVYHE